MNRLIEAWSKPHDAASNSNGAKRHAVDKQKDESTPPKWLQRIEDFMGEHPGATIGVAVALGVALGWMGKRK